MNYSEFLFNKLLCVSSEWFSNLEYDTQYDRNKAEYDDFKNSKYNVDTNGEYNSLVKQLEKDLNIGDCDESDLVVMDINVPSEGMDYVVDILSINKNGEILVQQFRDDVDSIFKIDYTNIIHKSDKKWINEILKNYLTDL